MAKLTLTDIQGQYASTTELNNNFALIETAIENTVSRDGTTPNTMSTDLDMNSNRISNLVDGTLPQHAATYNQVVTAQVESITDPNITRLASKAAAVALTLTSADDGKKMFITSDDGGEFTIRYDATAPYADNGGSYCGTEFIPTGGDGTIGFVRDHSGGVLVEWFGAVADGSTDNTTAIHNARDGGNDVLVFTDGVYAHTGLSANVANQKFDFINGASLFLINNSNTTSISVTANNVIINNPTIDGNKVNQTGGNGISITNVDDCRVLNATATDVKNYGIYGDRSDGLKIKDCTVIDSDNIGIFVEVTVNQDIIDLEVTGCYVDRSSLGVSIGEGGLKVRAATGFDLPRSNVSNNTVIMPVSPTDTAAICIEVWQSENGVISNNRTYNGYMGISAATVSATAISNNTCYGASTYGIELAVSCSDSVVSSNTINGGGVTTNGIILSTTPTNNIISDNSVSNLKTTGTIRGIKCQDGVGHSFSGNNINISSGYAYEMANCTEFSITGGNLDGNSLASKAIILDESYKCAISGVTATDFTQDGVLLFGGSAVTFSYISIVGNTFNNAGLAYKTSFTGGAAIGVRVVVNSNGGYTQNIREALYDIRDLWSTGSPEGVHTAGVGSTYMRRDGGTGTVLYIKETGTGNTGWVAK